MQAKEKLTTLYKAVSEGTYRLEGNKLYAPDGTWAYVIGDFTPRVLIHDINASAHFPDLLKLPRERLEPLQIGWRASDEGRTKIRPYIGTTQPWQVFAWATTRYGELYAHITWVVLTREGVRVSMHITARSWSQRWGKAEAVDLVASHLRREEWTPLLTMWLGDGEAERKKVLRGDYKIVIAAKEPWRFGTKIGKYTALVATGREAFVKLRETADAYGVLLDLLKAHKWIYVKFATDDGFRAALKQKNCITVEGVVMYLRLVSGRGGSLLAEHFTRDPEKAHAAADKLKAAGLRPNIVRSNANYVVYIATAEVLGLAKQDETTRKTIALYLAEKAKNGTPRQKEVAEKS
jgi:hypothetical protein